MRTTGRNVNVWLVLSAACLMGMGDRRADATEKLLVSSFSQSRLARYSALTGTLVDTINGGGALLEPLGATVGPDGNLYVASEGNNQILRFDRDTGVLLGAFVRDDPSTSATDETGGLDGPAAVLFGVDGNLYVSSFETDNILEYDGLTGEFIAVFVSSGSGGLDGPDAGMVFGPGGDLYVPSYWSNEVLRYSGVDGSFEEAFVAAGSAGLSRPRNLLFRPSDGHLLVTGEGSNNVLLYDGTTGAPIEAFIPSVTAPSGLALGPDGNLYVTSVTANSVYRYTSDTGEYVDRFVSGVQLPTFLLFQQDSSPDFTESEQFGEGSTIPIAWGDCDNDGALDLAVGNYFGEANRLYLSNGSGTFYGSDEFGSGNTFALVFGDFDNDGDSDIAVGNSGRNYLYVNDGNGGFLGGEEFGSLATVALAWGDVDNDGDLDLAVGNGILGPEQANYLYINNGDGSFTARAEFGEGQSDSLVWGDFDNDGDLDLAVGNGGFASVEQNYLYVNDGFGNFDGRAEFGADDTTVVAWGDANNDGLLDLAVGQFNNGQDLLYINKGDGTFEEQPAFGARDTNTLAWGDYDNDGDLDLVVGSGDFGSADQNYLYVNQGDGTFVEFAAFGLGSTDSVAWADYDGDGDLDLAVGNEHHPTTNYFYENNENDNDYLILRVVGHHHDLGAGFSNRDGIGARISVYEPGHICDHAYLLGYRQIEAMGGFSSQSSIEAEFGLPGLATVDVRIDWPGSDGQSVVQELTGVAVGQHLTVHEQAPVLDPDCNANGISDACDLNSGVSQDCNSTGIPDECDIANETSEDCTANGTPDECEPDCNNTGKADSCDIADETSEDCTANGIPDECEPDCNDTGQADSCDIANETSEDCSGNGIPDECEPDCNDTGLADSCDIANETSFDCNGNLVPDECDLADETSPDENGNGIPDECDLCVLAAQARPEMIGNDINAKNRFISIEAGDPGRNQAIRVMFVDLPSPFGVWNNLRFFVGEPFRVCENSGQVTPPEPDNPPDYGCAPAPELEQIWCWVAPLVCDLADAYFTDWSTWGVVHLYHEGVVPGGVYGVEVLDDTCSPEDDNGYSEPLTMTQARWGDVCGPGPVGACTRPPDGVVDVQNDVLGVLGKFANTFTLRKTSGDLEPGGNGSNTGPDLTVNVANDVLFALDAFTGGLYPFQPGEPCTLDLSSGK